MTAEKFFTLLLSGVLTVALVWVFLHRTAAPAPDAQPVPVAPANPGPAPTPSPSPVVRWQAASYEEALTLAAQHKRPILVDVGTKWCPPCRRLEQTLADPKVVAVLSQRYVFAKVDGDARRDLVKTLAVTGYPTLLVLDAAGTVAKRTTGYKSPDELVGWLAH